MTTAKQTRRAPDSRVPKCYKFDPDTIQRIERLHASIGVSRTEIIEEALERLEAWLGDQATP